jgi:hypothetical protein
LYLWRWHCLSNYCLVFVADDVNNTSHDSCDIMCLIYANMFTLLLLLSPGECCWSWWWVSSFHEVSSVLKCWLLDGAIGSSRTDTSSIVSLLWNGLNLLVMYEGKYRGQWLWEKWQSTIAGMDLPAWNGAKPPNWSTTIWYLPRMKWRPHQHPPNPFTWYLVWCL